MNTNRSIMVALALMLVGAPPAEGQLLRRGQLPEAPEVYARLAGDGVRIDRDGSATFRIAVSVPDDHHGYLDSGDEGYYIPFSFDFERFEEWAAKVVRAKRPAGERDDEAAAQVLRGTGAFEFRLESAGALLDGTEVPASLTYQICDDVTRVCYPPRQVAVSIRIAGGQSPP